MLPPDLDTLRRLLQIVVIVWLGWTAWVLLTAPIPEWFREVFDDRADRGSDRPAQEDERDARPSYPKSR